MFGLTTAATPMVSSPEPVTFRPATEVAARQARKLRESGADRYDMFAEAPRLIDATAGKVTAALVIDAIAPQVEGRIVRLD